MTGLEYIADQSLHPFWQAHRDPNKEDVADAFDQGVSEGYRQCEKQGIWTAIEYMVMYEDQPSMAADLARTMGITRDMAKELRQKSEYADIKGLMRRFLRNERFAGEKIPGTSKGYVEMKRR